MTANFKLMPLSALQIVMPIALFFSVCYCTAMKFTSFGYKRGVFVKLESGDDLLLSIEQAVQNFDIKSAIVTMIGGLARVKYGLFEGGGYKVMEKEAKCCFELLATNGNITQKEGRAMLHAHICVTDEGEGIAFGGHLMQGSIVHPFAEVFIQEIDVTLDRAPDPASTLWPIKL